MCIVAVTELRKCMTRGSLVWDFEPHTLVNSGHDLVHYFELQVLHRHEAPSCFHAFWKQLRVAST